MIGGRIQKWLEVRLSWRLIVEVVAVLRSVAAVRAITQPIQCDGEYGVWSMVPPTSQPVWALPMLMVAANGTTETQRCGWVSAPPYSMFTSWFDALISDVIDDPAIEPVLSSTSASSSPKAALCAVAAAFTVTGPMPMMPSSVGFTMRS